jgi:hypothetical protein
MANLTALTPEQILEIQSKTRTRGQYDEEFGNFLKADIPGAAVSLSEGVFAGKKAASVKTGFEGAIKRHNEQAVKTNGTPVSVKVASDDNNVYLLLQNA